MKLVYGLILSMGVVSCGSDDDGDDKNIVEEVGDALPNLVKQSGLPGTEWTSGCNSTNILNADVITSSSEELWSFAAAKSDVTRSFVVYDNENCDQELGRIDVVGNYELEERNDAGVNPINLKFDKVTVQSNSDALTTALNAVSWCGIDSWSNGNEQDITSTLGEGLCQLPVVVGQETYDQVQVDDDEMFFGTPLAVAPTSEADRPSNINGDVVFNKR